MRERTKLDETLQELVSFASNEHNRALAGVVHRSQFARSLRSKRCVPHQDTVEGQEDNCLVHDQGRARVHFFFPSMSKCATKAFVRVGPRLDRCRPRGRIRWSRGSLVRTQRARVQQVASKRLQGARRPIEKKKKKSKAMTEARRNERAKCAAKVKERSGTRPRQARTTAADGGRQR